MSACIKCAIRCRPYTIDDKLGVVLVQNGEESGEVTLINSEYSTTRFPFTYAWWSAYGYQRHLTGDNMKDADNMILVNQSEVYKQCGTKIKEDLFSGSAVVLFAYGLSGSGKTFTVFGPDATDAPEAWFKHSEPHDLWGIFPRLGYEIFKERKDGWKVSMKYFQNVVDIVRDLMSPNAEEQHYKNGMRKDTDGFMDIDWCMQQVISSWNNLREVFQVANARKAIAPTQFNPMSTRGHCIMVLEVEMPSPETEGMKQRGRVYVCDLAGTEPAGDIVYVLYQKVSFDDGSFEYKFKGPHSDVNKTKELQDQGKKINLSLSEMAQFFMKMAEAVMKKKLKPGMSIPGCNSYFLCKYLKDTMLQAKTYLFCAIRPEVEFHRYTFATLGFAKNASVVKLAPKKAGAVAASANELKLMDELEAMKELVASLKAQTEAAAKATTTSSGADDEAAQMLIKELQDKLAAKQNDLARELGASDGDSAAEEKKDKKLEEQRVQYAKRGISLTAYESDTQDPYFINIDEDPFRSKRLMFIIKQELTTFGAKGDIQPISLSVVRDHCQVRFDGNELFLVGGQGDVFHNGKYVAENIEMKLNPFDRIAMGDQLMLFRWAGHEPEGVEEISADDAVLELQEGMQEHRRKPAIPAVAASDISPSRRPSIALAAKQEMEIERQKLLEEREKWEREKSQLQSKRNEEEYQRAMASVDNQILDLLPKAKEAKQIVELMNRTQMTFDVVLEKGQDHIPRVKISVTNKNPKHEILMDPNEFLPKLSLLKDELMKLRTAIESEREYTLPEKHDPLNIFFDNDFHLGTATHWPEYLIFNLETDPDERMQDIKNSAVPYNTVGLLDVVWTPLAGPNDEDENKPIRDIDSEDDLIGKPWTYRLEVKKAMDLPVFCEMSYVQYEFFGETFTTETVEQQTYSPVYDYVKIHHIDKVSPDFVNFLKGSFEMNVHVTPHVKGVEDKISTNNDIVRECVITGEPPVPGRVPSMGSKSLKGGSSQTSDGTSQQLIDTLNKKIEDLTSENSNLKNKVKELELKILQLEGTPIPRQSIRDAIIKDAVING